MTAYDAVLFDWNGTLVDDITRALDAANVTLASLGRPPLPGIGHFRSTFRLPLVEWFRHLGVPTDRLQLAADRWNTEMASRPASLRSGARSLLEALKAAGVSTGVVSAASRAAVAADAVRLGVAELLGHLDTDASNKRDAIRSAMAATGTHRVAYVGDTEYDMVEAVLAGADPIGLAGGYRPADALRTAGAQYICDDLHEVGQLVLRPT